MLVLSRADVEALLDPDLLVDALAAAMADLSAGRASVPPRVAARVAEQDAVLGAMPAFLPSSSTLAAKLVSVFPHNVDQPSHQAVVACFDPDDGSPVALMDGTAITATRTAAGSLLASRLLARPGARVVAVVGTGVQAGAHVRALARLDGIEVVRVAGRDPARAAALAGERHDVGVAVEAAATIEDAVRTADVVCTTTHAAEPVLSRGWLAPGTHVCSVGFDHRGAGELDDATVRDALVVVESRATAVAPPPAGAVELHRGHQEGWLDPADLVEVGEIVAGTASARVDEGQLTLYKSVGVAVQDAAAAAVVLAAARQQGVGVDIPI